MINPDVFYNILKRNGIDFYAGVPDSLFKDFLLFLSDKSPGHLHHIVANEAHAVSMATGYFCVTGNTPVVYLQNSGLGNIVNPVVTMFNAEVMPVPMLLLIGWRGMPGVKDEPQHYFSGKVTLPLLELMKIQHEVADESVLEEQITRLLNKATKEKSITALVIPKNLFAKYQSESLAEPILFHREHVIELIIKHCKGDETIVTTTGKTTREFIELNHSEGNKIKSHFPCTGAMGLAAPLALGISLFHQSKCILIDGDGALLMHMGAFAWEGVNAKDNFIHLLLNNGAHESVGGQPTIGKKINFKQIAQGAGYKKVYTIQTEEALIEWLMGPFLQKEKQFVEIKIDAYSRGELSRPSLSHEEMLTNFINALKHSS